MPKGSEKQKMKILPHGKQKLPANQCTMVNKGVIIEILDFELGTFSENLKHITTWSKGIFGFYLQKKNK